jgi:type I restriction enzyme M protein
MVTVSSPSRLDAHIKRICNVLRRSNCQGALQYIPELTWLLFLRFFDEREGRETLLADAQGIRFDEAIGPPYRWRDWAAPEGSTRSQLQLGPSGGAFAFLEEDLLPYLQSLGNNGGTPRQRLISQIVSGINGTRVDTERNFFDVVDLIHEVELGLLDNQHLFALSAAYESLLPVLGEKSRDGGQFFTPREVVRAMVKVVEPKLGETVFDPCCGTGGFLAQAHEYMRDRLPPEATGEALEQLSRETFYGCEKDNTFFPIALANLVLHGIDEPHIQHGNTLTGAEEYGGLYDEAPDLFDVVLTNPPFGGEEGLDAQRNYAYPTKSTQVLFLQEVIDSLKPDGRAGFVIDEGLLFRTNEEAFVQTKRKLLDECDLYCIVSLAPGVFVNAGTGNKTNLLFFEKGRPTKRIWYYELYPEGGRTFTKRKRPLTLANFEEFFELLPRRADSERSWTVTREEIEENGYDLKAVNPHRPDDSDKRTPEELLDEIDKQGRELEAALKDLRAALGK